MEYVQWSPALLQTEYELRVEAVLDVRANMVQKYVPEMEEASRQHVLYSFLSFIYGICPYISGAEKQKSAMEKVTLHAVGEHQFFHMDGAPRTVETVLNQEECAYPEASCVLHVMTYEVVQNQQATVKYQHVWSAETT